MIIVKSNAKKNYLHLDKKKMIKKLPCIKSPCPSNRKIASGSITIEDKNSKDMLTLPNPGDIHAKMEGKLQLLPLQKSYQFFQENLEIILFSKAKDQPVSPSLPWFEMQQQDYPMAMEHEQTSVNFSKNLNT